MPYDYQNSSVSIFESHHDPNIFVFPNPITDNFIFVSAFFIGYEMALTDLSGAIIAKHNIKSSKVDLPELPQGVYLLRLRLNEDLHQFKVIKQ